MRRIFYLQLPDGCRWIIGESDVAWTFALHVRPEDPSFPQTLGDWKEFFDDENNVILDDKSKEWSASEMRSFIQDRAWYVPASADDFYMYCAKHNAICGPNNLLRRRISDVCIGHAKACGTWDYVTTKYFEADHGG